MHKMQCHCRTVVAKIISPSFEPISKTSMVWGTSANMKRVVIATMHTIMESSMTVNAGTDSSCFTCRAQQKVLSACHQELDHYCS